MHNLRLHVQRTEAPCAMSHINRRRASGLELVGVTVLRALPILHSSTSVLYSMRNKR